MENTKLDLSSKIPGWGIDADKEKRVGAHKFSNYPSLVYEWKKIPQQVPNVKINLSASRPHLTPVMGTTLPPKGLSGVIRNYAYTLVENRPSHWMLLMFADRVDVVESSITDFVFGPADETGKVSKSPRPIVVGAAALLLVTGTIWYLSRRKDLQASIAAN